jgi:uncharacterized protein (UPF0216 family)
MIISCNLNDRKDDKIVARVGDKRLYFSEMSGIFPQECSKEDSISLARLYIESWIKTCLLLKKAELNLVAEELNISKEIENYRTQLLIYKYKDRLLQEKLDTTVTESDMKRYYETSIDNFLSEEYLIMATYIKLPADAPSLWKVRQWLASNDENDAQNLIDYCRKYAVKYNFFDDNWVQWASIEPELPQKEYALRQLKQYERSRIEQHDGQYYYFVQIKEKRSPGDAAPLIFVKNKVKSSIINKRKLKFISELEQNIYNDALIKKQFEIIKND